MLFYTEAISVNKEMHRSWFLFLDSTRPLFVFSLNSEWLTAILRFLFIFHQKYYMRVRCFNFEAFWSILLLIKKIWKINININNILLSTTLALVLSLSSCHLWFCFKTGNDFSENMIKFCLIKRLALEQRWQFQRDILCACHQQCRLHHYHEQQWR